MGWGVGWGVVAGSGDLVSVAGSGGLALQGSLGEVVEMGWGGQGRARWVAQGGMQGGVAVWGQELGRAELGWVGGRGLVSRAG